MGGWWTKLTVPGTLRCPRPPPRLSSVADSNPSKGGAECRECEKHDDNTTMMSCGDEDVVGSGGKSEELHDLFCEIWERESKPELTFAITGVGSVRGGCCEKHQKSRRIYSLQVIQFQCSINIQTRRSTKKVPSTLQNKTAVHHYDSSACMVGTMYSLAVDRFVFLQPV